MIIEKIIIKSFGLIKNMTLEFADGINVIEGENEVGKSTIAGFIKYMLYGFREESGEEITERQKRINWDTRTAEGSMYVRVRGKKYLINRMTTETGVTLGRPTYKEESAIIDLATGAPAFGKVSAGEVFFGVDADLFENTAYIGQIGDSKINKGSVRESIENILFSGAETVNNKRAAGKLREKMEKLFHEGGRGGTIVDLMRKQEELEDRLRESDEENKLILTKEAELHEIRMKKGEYEDTLKKLQDLDHDYNNMMLIQTFDKLHALEEEAEQKNLEYNKFIEENTHKGFVPERAYITDIAVAKRGVNDAYSQLVSSEEEYERERSMVGITREMEGLIELCDSEGGEDEIRACAVSLHRAAVRDGALVTLGGLLGVAAAVLFILAGGNIGMIIGGALLAAGFVGLAGWFSYSLLKNRRELSELSGKLSTEGYRDLIGKLEHVKEQRIKRDSMMRSGELARKMAENARMCYESAKIDLSNVILKWGEEPPLTNLNGFLEELEGKVNAFLEEKERLLKEKTELEMTVREIRLRLADVSEIDVRAKVLPIKRKALVGINHEDIINDIAKNRALIAEEEARAEEVEGLLFDLKSRTGDPGELYSKIQAMKRRTDELRHKHKSYYIALKAIEGAAENLRSEISPRLGEYSTRMMELMTDKKYTDFSVDDTMTVTFAADSGVKSVDFLSGGTRDLAYVAVRLALIDMLYTEKPPLLLDESFAHQDNNRAKAMMKAVSSVGADGMQSFVFTCRAREGALAKELSKKSEVFRLSAAEATR
ncbi:MAG: AAA family ATPase [Clostridia bacterium]|nr:AAA family ATPase [Clostridia bacterium]